MKLTKGFVLPEKYNAAILHEGDSTLQISEQKMDPLKKGEVWIQLKAAPINPSDLAMVAGTYPHKKTHPFVPGLEGSGIVVASGGGFMANYMLGKRVACSPTETGDGTWAEFMKTDASRCIPLSKDISFEQGASALVNPLTVLALIAKVKQHGESFVNTAAGGALGKMLIKLAKKQGLKTINLVRQEKQLDELKAIGGNVVLNTTAGDFENEYKAACNKMQPQAILDAVGGSFSDILLQHAPSGCTLIAYASLSRENISISPQPILRDNKTIEGFHLGSWLAKQSLLKKIRLTREAQKEMKAGTINTPIHKRFKLDEINHALESYYNAMSNGKWLLTF
jgi:NADPH:quinone reductase-like Zn-dependent oxidoreductase